MGLEGVELLMALEEGFGVTISDTEASACVTPAAVIDLIFGKLRSSDERVCVSQRAFYLLRKGLTQTLGVERRGVALDADIRSLAGSRSHSQVWYELRTVVQARSWPSLARPPWLVWILWLLAAGVFLGLLTSVHWAVAAGGGLLVAFVVTRLTRSYCTHIPARYAQLRKLVPFAVTSDAIVWTRDQVAALVKKLVIEQLGVNEGEYREDGHFIEDFGMGR